MRYHSSRKKTVGSHSSYEKYSVEEVMCVSFALVYRHISANGALSPRTCCIRFFSVEIVDACGNGSVCFMRHQIDTYTCVAVLLLLLLFVVCYVPFFGGPFEIPTRSTAAGV